MPAPSKTDLLPEEVRADLDRRIVANGFGGYVALSDWLATQGYEISKSAIGMRGQNLKRRCAAVRASTEAARLITAEAPDDADERSNAIIALVQTELFEAILELQEAGDTEDKGERIELLGKAAKNIATLTRATVARNRWAIEVRQRVEAAAQSVADTCKRAGISDAMADAIRRQVLGIAT